MGELNAERSAAGAAEVDMELHRVPFFLEPGYIHQAEGWWETHTARMVRKFGSQSAFDQVKSAHRLMPRAREVGLDADGWTDANLDRRRQSSTLRAHRLIRWLDETRGWECAERAYAHLHSAHFVEGQLLNDLTVLAGAAEAAGADVIEADSFLRGAGQADAVLRLVDDHLRRPSGTSYGKRPPATPK